MQKYIGNIIVSNLKYKIDDCFKKCLSYSDIDDTLPTLIIGLDNAKANISDFNILKREYNENNMLWWTLSKTEKRIDYDKNIVDFYEFCINNILKNVQYTNINIFNLNYTKIKKCINFVRNNSKKYFYIDNNKFIFVYDIEKDDKSKDIYGFSLNTIAFLGISKKKVIKLIKENANNIQMNNFYSIPNNVRKMIKDNILSKIVLKEYFT